MRLVCDQDIVSLYSVVLIKIESGIISYYLAKMEVVVVDIMSTC